MANSSFNGSGLFQRSYDFTNDRDAGIKILASRMDEELDGIATGLSTCILKDGTQTVTANIPMSSFKFTGLAAGSSAGDSVRYEQVVLLSAATNQTITRTATGAVLTLESTEAGASRAPDLVLYRNSATPADADVGPGILFDGEDSGGTQTTFGLIHAVFNDITDATEDGSLHFSVMTAGTLADELTLTGAALYPTTTAGLDLGGSSNLFNVGYLTTIELGHASDTTLARAAAGRMSVEGITIEPGASRASFYVHKNGSVQTVSSVAETQITFSTEGFDTNSYFASSTWTPPAGFVLINLHATIAGVGAGQVYVRIKKNSTTIAEWTQTAATINAMDITAIAASNGTDTFAAYVEAPSDSSYSVGGTAAETYMTGTMI